MFVKQNLRKSEADKHVVFVVSKTKFLTACKNRRFATVKNIIFSHA